MKKDKGFEQTLFYSRYRNDSKYSSRNLRIMSIRKRFLFLKDREHKKQKVTEVTRSGEIGSLVHVLVGI